MACNRCSSSTRTRDRSPTTPGSGPPETVPYNELRLCFAQSFLPSLAVGDVAIRLQHQLAAVRLVHEHVPAVHDDPPPVARSLRQLTRPGAVALDQRVGGAWQLTDSRGRRGPFPDAVSDRGLFQGCRTQYSFFIGTTARG
jgi:hypothetical protein